MRNYKNFISFEGLDFSGKSGQAAVLIERLRQMNLPVHLLREPGGTVISEKIREIILDTGHAEMHPRAEILLYSAARTQLVHQKIIPLLEKGEYVIADRFFDSTTAYQGYGRGLDIEFVASLNRFATSALFPFKTLLIDISPQEARRRRELAARESDRLENEDVAFYQTIRDGFLELAAHDPQRYLIIDGQRPFDDVSADIWRQISAFWPVP